ncbi:DUF664 domain-containing protein [Nocardioides immobilis]|uniref:DUF664 domain-containing protein n=1 Tax=Nocardioides immobilis TaxID=2049295 RepID=A0A417Y1G1_9ACTN|nr:DUF664 domain-containing protein [Nocardioides immobilis]RHW26473.1 DUF664 domain-containing protein [Nocardioides immobilis]
MTTLDARDTAIRPEPPLAGDETETLLGSLERQRATFAWKVGELDDEALGLRLGPSAMTLGGLIKHLALIEDQVFTHALLGRPLPAPWDAVDWESDVDWEWQSAATDSAAQLYAQWRTSVERSRAAVRRALGDGGLEHSADVVLAGGPPSLRRLLVDVIEEYARHTGHADLIRESIDGLVGEDPPAHNPTWPAPRA